MNQGQHVVNENTRNEDLQSIACYECPTLIHVLVPLFLFFFRDSVLMIIMCYHYWQGEYSDDTRGPVLGCYHQTKQRLAP